MKGIQSKIPITVRQLEAIIRLSESIAKIELSENVEIKHVKMAHDLFQNSTMSAIEMGGESNKGQIDNEKISKIEEALLKRIPIGAKVSTSRLFDELVSRFNNIRMVQTAIYNLTRRGELATEANNKVLVRKGGN